MHDFVFAAHLPRVVFGAGALQRMPDELAALGLGRALVLSTPIKKTGWPVGRMKFFSSGRPPVSATNAT